MKKLHLAIGVADIEESVKSYSIEFEKKPDLIIKDEYALWRTETLNVSIRKTKPEEVGRLRHLGWEKEDLKDFSIHTDCNGIDWEEFNAKQQEDEIKSVWPQVEYRAR